MEFGGGAIEVSAEYTQTAKNILGNDTDVQSLVTQGFNITAINPIIKSVIDADGTITTKATNAMVILVNGTSGYATANVDIEQSRVLKLS
jgi:hypothetical protein